MKKIYFSIPFISFLKLNPKRTHFWIKCKSELPQQSKSKGVFNYSALALAFLFLFCNHQFVAQSNQDIINYNGFNELYWKSLALKKQLNPTETKEFMDFQKIRYLYPDSFTYKNNDNAIQTGGKLIGGGAITQTATGCNNIDFEAGSTSGWTLSSGFHPNSSSTPTCCPTSGAQNSVMTGPGLDPFGGFPVVFPGGSFSLRLGNSGTGAQADRLQQKIFVTPANANFTYRYAVVLQDPGHNLSEQPAFTIEMIDTLGNQIPCTYYNVAAGSNIPGFSTSTVNTGVIYKPWTSVVVDLTPNLGQNVFIRFTTYDCSLGGHFGYAYVDGFCTNFATDVADTTCPGVPISMCGPIGFGFYSWSGPGVTTNSNQCISVMTPGVYTCQTILVPGCPGPTFTHTLSTLYKPVISFTPSAAHACALQYSFASSSSIATGSITNYNWTFGNNTSSSISLNPVVSYTAPGTYPVKFKATSNRSCSDSVTQNITIYPYPVIGFSPPNSCLNSVVNFSSTSTIAVGSVNTFTWNFGNGTVSTATNPTNTYSLVGSYNVTLTASSDQGCTSTAVNALTIHPLPQVSFTASNLCFGNTTTFNPTVTISAGSISSFSWNLGNGATSTNFSTSTNYTNYGNYVVSYTAASNFQCQSSQTQTISVHPLPVVSFSVADACLNAPSAFTQSATIPLGSISSYSWNFGDGNNVGAVSNPNHTYSSAITYTPQFTAISNMGCVQITSNTAVVHPLPSPSFIATTQCVNSALNFTNTSSITAGSINSYTWNFGSGQTSSVINPIYTFTSNGTWPVTLTATSNQSCVSSYSANMIIQALPTVAIIPTSTLCSTANTIALSGTVTGISNSGQWSSGGTGSFTNATSLNSTYSISTADKTAGTVIFTLTSTSNSACAAQTNTTALIITPLATVNAGPNLNICSSQPTVALNGSVNSPSGTGTWLSGGTGLFPNGNATITTTYSTTTTDINSALVVFTLSSTNNGICPAVSDTVMMRISLHPTVSAMPSLTMCSNQNALNLSGTVTGVTNLGTWLTNGTGSFNTPNQTNTSYLLSNADKTLGLIQFSLQSTNNGVCPAAVNQLSLTIVPLATVNAGNNLLVCSSQNTIALNGTIVSPSGAGAWSGNGAGNYIPANSILNTSYSMTAADINSGFVTFTLVSTNNNTCPAVSDTVMMRISKQPTVTTIPSLTLCSNNNLLALSGTVSGVTSSGVWSTDGSGNFNNPNLTNCTYTITNADKNNGVVNFTLSSTNNGVCPAASQNLSLSITPLATVNAGPNFTICNTQSVNLIANIIGATNTGTWSSTGNGTFLAVNSLTTAYIPGSTDLLFGVVDLYLTSTNNGFCAPVRDTVHVKINNQSTISITPTLAICSSVNTIALTATILGTSNSGSWTCNGTGNFANTNSVLTTYSLSAADRSLSAILFTLSSTNNGACSSASQSQSINIVPIATVDAGVNQYLCSAAQSVALSGTVLNIPSGKWTTSGGGTFVNGNSLNPFYYFSPNDINTGQAIFTLSSTNNSICPVVMDTVMIKILRQATVNAGPDLSLCSNNNSITLNGLVFGATTTGTWITSGAGVFSPSNIAKTSYVIGAGDLSLKNLQFILFSTNNGICNVASDTLRIQISTLPTVSVSGDTSICGSQNPFQLSGTILSGSGVQQWLTNGTGSFSPNAFTNPTKYFLSNTDKQQPYIIFTLSSLNSNACGNINRSFVLSLLPSPTVKFSASTTNLTLPSNSITLTNESIGAVSYTWSLGNNTTTNATNTAAFYNEVGYYRVILKGESENQCLDSSETYITVISDVQWPNAFTPNPNGSNGGRYENGDFSNDVFFPVVKGVRDYDLMIFNRWGQMLFQSKDLKIGWDGYFNGKLCQQDIYVWKAKFTFLDGREYIKTGSISLIR